MHTLCMYIMFEILCDVSWFRTLDLAADVPTVRQILAKPQVTCLLYEATFPF